MDFPEYTPRCPEGVAELKITVSPGLADQEGKMRPEALAHAMETITEQQLEKHGWGRTALQKKNMVWVVGWTSIQIKRLPHCGESLLLRTWPGRDKFSMRVRKYAFYTAAGEALVSTASLFLLMDRKSRKMISSATNVNLPAVVIPGESDVPKLQIAFPERLPHNRLRTVCCDEIDANGHMNNSCYLAWADALCTSEYRTNHEPGSIWVQYAKELRESQTVVLEYGMEKDVLFVRGKADGANAFLAAIQYRK